MKTEISEVTRAMESHGYVADRAVATAVHLAGRLGMPLLVEGEAGVGKTEIARVLAAMLDTELIRLQCYEGLDVHAALYEWNYGRQLLRIRLEEGKGLSSDDLESTIFAREFLLERPLLRAITQERPPVLLIDEIDRADDEFEAFLLELLSDFQVTIPELGTIRAVSRPRVVLTSNGTRELGDALRRRCLYAWIDYPDVEREVAILRARLPRLEPALGEEVARFVHLLREERLFKTPGVAETLDWAAALADIDAPCLEPELVRSTLCCLVKDRHDLERVAGGNLDELVHAATSAADAGTADGTGEP